MKKVLTPDKLLELIKEISVEDRVQFEFIDNHWRKWQVDLTNESFVADDSIPEDQLTDDDYEEVPRCDIYCLDNCYLEFSSFKDTHGKALLQCFQEANLIDEQRGLAAVMPTY